MSLSDSTGAIHQIEIEEGYIISDGSSIGMPGQCFINVYQYPRSYAHQANIYLGEPFMNSYYVSLSMDSYVKGEASFLKVGFGPICPYLNLAAVQYLPKYSSKEPSKEDISS